jgi:hypothetical protein
MTSNSTIPTAKKQSVRTLEAANFFLADVQTGLGPFLAAYLAGAGWGPDRVGMALSIGGMTLQERGETNDNSSCAVIRKEIPA